MKSVSNTLVLVLIIFEKSKTKVMVSLLLFFFPYLCAYMKGFTTQQVLLTDLVTYLFTYLLISNLISVYMVSIRRFKMFQKYYLILIDSPESKLNMFFSSWEKLMECVPPMISVGATFVKHISK